MKAVFVAGTDTGVGKTVVCGLLGRFFKERGVQVITQKWIQSGSRRFSPDIACQLKLMQQGKKEVSDYLSYMLPYSFKFSASPHLAAQLEQRNIKEDRIKKSLKVLSRCFDLVIVEGIGGVLVPFNNKRLVVDMVKEFKLPVIIVAANKLGAINHTLLTIEALKKRRIKIIGVIFNNLFKKENPLILRDNPLIIKKISKIEILGVLPYSKNKEVQYEKFQPIGRKIISNK
ncbi:MAG: dethiobiotin synthase [Candidatus Omnitrophota bacterium]